MVQPKQYQIPTDRLYEPNTNMWVQPCGGVVRIGFDDLGQETHGDIAFLQLATPGTILCRGQELGSLEAGKYVGPILSPVSGRVSAINQRALDDPRLVNIHPYADGWLVEIALADGERCEHLLGEPEVIRRWFNDRVREFREKGVLTE
jgi:glycine cleavage system H protein